MKMKSVVLMLAVLISMRATAKGAPAAGFADAEANFKLVMQNLLEKYVDKNISKEELYRAASAGMLASLNSSDETWNKLLDPEEMKEMEEDLSGKVTGIGATIKFDDHTGYGRILKALPGSPAEKAGMKLDDQILSVAGQKFKGKLLVDMVNLIRGDVGQKVEMKVLRDDRILTLSVRREVVPWATVGLEYLGKSTAVLSIGFFSELTAKMVETRLQEISQKGIRKLIVDVRNNQGGSFEEAIKTAGYFLPENSVVALTKARNGQMQRHLSSKSLITPEMQIVLLTNKKTFCGAELFVAALKESRPENRAVKIVGEATFGKWNVQSVETLPNHFAIKYTVEEFQSPRGNSFQGTGIKPDIDVSLAPDTELDELRAKMELSKRLVSDVQLKAAVEIAKAL